MKERVLSFLNLKKSESTYVFDLLRVQFFIGIANSFINIVVFTYFIYNFSVSGLPYAYLSIAAVLFILNLGYEKLEHHFSPVRLLQFIVVCSAIILLLFWFGLLVSSNYSVIFMLLIWNTLFYMFTGYAFWGLVSLLFNIRESKRIFSIVGAGDIPAKLVGYAVSPLLIPLIGLNNLLVLSILSMITGLYLLNKIHLNKRWKTFQHKAHTGNHQHAHHGSTLKENLGFFFRNKLIFSISLLSIISYNVFQFIDFTFIAQIKTKSYSIATLAAFIAIFFALGRFAAIILKLALTSRAIERLGIISCLLITPVTLFLFCLLFVLYDDGTHYNLYLFGLMAMLTEVLRSAMQEPVFFILFQPLNEHLRLKGHIIAKGYMLPPSLFIVGLTLILLPELGIDLSIMLTVKILLLNLALWVAVIFYIKREYVRCLRSSIAKGVFSSEYIYTYDQKTITILLEKIENGRDTEIIYSLKLLESANYEHLDNLLEKQLHHRSAEIKKYALFLLNERGKIDIGKLKELLNTETDLEVKERMVSLLCKWDPFYLKAAADFISEQEHSIRKIIITHLLDQNEFIYLHKAGTEINALLRSPNPAERELAVDIISELKNIKFTDAIEELIQDPDHVVRRNAIIAACKLRIEKLLPYIFDLLHSPAHKYLVLQGLFQYGDFLFEDIQYFKEEEIERHLSHLIKIAGKVKGSHSTRFLLERLSDPSAPAEKIVHSLWAKEFKAETEKEITQLQALLTTFLKRGMEKITDYNAVPVFYDYELVKDCIRSEVRNDLETTLKICSLVYQKKEINRVLELILYGEQQKIFNAMEMLELVLPKKISMHINVLFDYVMDPTHIRKTGVRYDVKSLFKKIIITQADFFNSWTKAVCIYCSFKNNQLEIIKALPASDKRENEIIRETKNYVLKAVH